MSFSAASLTARARRFASDTAWLARSLFISDCFRSRSSRSWSSLRLLPAMSSPASASASLQIFLIRSSAAFLSESINSLQLMLFHREEDHGRNNEPEDDHGFGDRH